MKAARRLAVDALDLRCAQHEARSTQPGHGRRAAELPRPEQHLARWRRAAKGPKPAQLDAERAVAQGDAMNAAMGPQREAAMTEEPGQLLCVSGRLAEEDGLRAVGELLLDAGDDGGAGLVGTRM